jgi:hypothetical protein
MVLLHVQYDAYTRQFKLIDREMAHALVDGETYALLADVSVQDLTTAALQIISGLGQETPLLS